MKDKLPKQKLYSKIWQLAKAYYERGRPSDIAHIKWMMKEGAKICKEENLDDSLLMPLIILHDIGYSAIEEKEKCFTNLVRRLHMKRGAEIGRKILEEVGYPKEKTEKIVFYISVHDAWALGKHKLFRKDKILGILNDLDFIWMLTDSGWKEIKRILKMKDEEMLEWIKKNEKLKNRPFRSKSTKRLFENLLKVRESKIH